MCGCDYCNNRGIPEPDCCPKCDAVIEARETDLGAASELHLTRNGRLVVGLPWSDPNSDPLGDVQQLARDMRAASGKGIKGARPQFIVMDEINDFTAGGTA